MVVRAAVGSDTSVSNGVLDFLACVDYTVMGERKRLVYISVTRVGCIAHSFVAGQQRINHTCRVQFIQPLGQKASWDRACGTKAGFRLKTLAYEAERCH